MFLCIQARRHPKNLRDCLSLLRYRAPASFMFASPVPKICVSLISAGDLKQHRRNERPKTHGGPKRHGKTEWPAYGEPPQAARVTYVHPRAFAKDCPALPKLCSALPCPALPCSALPCPGQALPCPALPCPAQAQPHRAGQR